MLKTGWEGWGEGVGKRSRGRDQYDERRSLQTQPVLWSFKRCSTRSPGDRPFRQGRNPARWRMTGPQREQMEGSMMGSRFWNAKTCSNTNFPPSLTSQAWVYLEPRLVTQWLAAHLCKVDTKPQLSLVLRRSDTNTRCKWIKASVYSWRGDTIVTHTRDERRSVTLIG